MHTFEGDDFLLGVHDGRVGRNRAAHDIVGVGEVNDHNLVLFPHFLPHADEVVRFQGQCLCAGVRMGQDKFCQETIRTWNEMEAGWIPIEESWRCSQNAMGRLASMVPVLLRLRARAFYGIGGGDKDTERWAGRLALGVSWPSHSTLKSLWLTNIYYSKFVSRAQQLVWNILMGRQRRIILQRIK